MKSPFIASPAFGPFHRHQFREGDQRSIQSCANIGYSHRIRFKIYPKLRQYWLFTPNSLQDLFHELPATSPISAGPVTIR
jgi:hypothetical protein